MGTDKWDRIAILYWHYHFKVYGPHEHLWGVPKPTGKPGKRRPKA